jgi:hypothetical protein
MTLTAAVALLDAIRGHLADFELPELYSITITRTWGEPNVTAQLACDTLPQVAEALLAWVDTLTGPTIEAWRVPRCDTVHLSVIGHLSGGIRVAVYGGVAYTNHRNCIGRDLAPDASKSVSLSVLRERAILGQVIL